MIYGRVRSGEFPLVYGIKCDIFLKTTGTGLPVAFCNSVETSQFVKKNGMMIF
ncbi:hypothetical protein A3Q56_04584 [Intoshia linei]|uniref:Uncharacterized protein n=1 Tax=Intoshia linei TaxID=1819745 RepID=A0A177B232_9BILA|nr:hypothetical protein A3Q56_04584 [Intoshia linei]